MVTMQAAVFVEEGRIELIGAAYDLFGHQRDGVLKVAIRP